MEYTCPYCETDQDYNGDALSEDEQYEEECPNCEKMVVLVGHHDYWISAEKVKEG